jgi:hypothetical protein
MPLTKDEVTQLSAIVTQIQADNASHDDAVVARAGAQSALLQAQAGADAANTAETSAKTKVSLDIAALSTFVATLVAEDTAVLVVPPTA